MATTVQKPVNFRRGFFRLWVVLSLFFIGIVLFVTIDDIQKEFAKVSALESVATRRLETERDKFLLPVLCGDARGKLGKDYSLSSDKGPGPWDKYAKVNPFDTCWYSVATFRNHYNEYADLSDANVYWKLNEKYAGRAKPARPWQVVGKTALITLGVPAVFLVLGSLLGWALTGFTRRS
jgi:hypothetical protein